jgi:DNA/RNA endonuclease G (NUC1)
MSEIKIGDKVFTNQMSLQPLSESQIVRYETYRCNITKKIIKRGVSKTGHYDVMVRSWDKSPDWVVVKITPKRIGVLHKNDNRKGIDRTPTFLAYHFVKKEGAN